MATTGLVENQDFSSDLLLNKVMNGQYRANSGKTITLAGRLNAADLDLDTHVQNIEAESVKKSLATADATTDLIAEFYDAAKKLYDINSDTSMTATDRQQMAQQIKASMDSILSTEVNGTKVLQSTAAVGLGHSGGSISVGLDLTSDGMVSSLYSLANAMSGNGSTVNVGSLESGMSRLLVLQSKEAMKASILQNRYDVLNDMAASFKNASDDQVVTAGGNSTSLLNNLLS